MENQLQELKNEFTQHRRDDLQSFGSIEAKLDEIKENHLFHLREDLAKNSVNTEWLIKYHYIVISASVGALIVGVINMIK